MAEKTPYDTKNKSQSTSLHSATIVALWRKIANGKFVKRFALVTQRLAICLTDLCC
ncbi:hypothetical protein [Komarekiella delphini-convector]|uniref:hypothetical protein n=1 Tax=Komarekiella delphini-convector TaxID=3050158 RepID=UPI001CD8E3EF|nr:hypothetical protein [Komarekiella delphini-convector]